MVVFSTITFTPYVGMHLLEVMSPQPFRNLENRQPWIIQSHHLLTWLIKSKEDLIKEWLRRRKKFQAHKEKGNKSAIENQALHLPLRIILMASETLTRMPTTMIPPLNTEGWGLPKTTSKIYDKLLAHINSLIMLKHHTLRQYKWPESHNEKLGLPAPT